MTPQNTSAGDNLSPEERFKQAIADQVREKVGDLIPEDILREQIDFVLSSCFFRKSGYGSGDIVPTQMMQDIVRERVEATVKEVLEPALKSVQSHINAVVRERIERGFLACMIAEIDNVIRMPISSEISQLKYDLQNKGINVY